MSDIEEVGEHLGAYEDHEGRQPTEDETTELIEWLSAGDVLRCAYCESRCYSASELLACEKQCGEEDRNTRGYFGRKNPNRRN